VNLDELLKLVEAIAGSEEEAASVKTEPSLGMAPRAPGLLERRWAMPVAAVALVLLAFCAGWLLRPAPRLAAVLGRGPLLQAPAPVDRVPSAKRPMPLSGLLP
jgi:hypothetical protein